jgi:hypothetical protein
MNVYYHTVQDYSVLYNIVVHSVIYEGWHLAYMRKTLALFLYEGRFGPINPV